MFNSVDNVDRNTVDKVERAGDSRLSTNRRQIGDFGGFVDFVASMYRAVKKRRYKHGLVTCAKIEVMRSVRSVCHSVCVLDYCKCN